MTKEKTFSVKYTGNADKDNQSTSIKRPGGSTIVMGGAAGELTESEISRLRTAGLQLDVGKEIKDPSDDDGSGDDKNKTASGSRA